MPSAMALLPARWSKDGASAQGEPYREVAGWDGARRPRQDRRGGGHVRPPSHATQGEGGGAREPGARGAHAWRAPRIRLARRFESMPTPRTRLDKVVDLRERVEDHALASFARARTSAHGARARLDGAVQASRADARSVGPVELWVVDEHAHRRALQAVRV